MITVGENLNIVHSSRTGISQGKHVLEQRTRLDERQPAAPRSRCRRKLLHQRRNVGRRMDTGAAINPLAIATTTAKD